MEPENETNCLVDMSIRVLTMIIVEYDLLDFIFT